MSAIDLIIFDCDGVLVDTEEASSRAMAEAIALLGQALPWQEVHRRFTGMMLADIVTAIEQDIGRSVPPDWLATFRRMATHAFAAGVEPVAGVPELLADLGVDCCVASNGPREKMAITLGAAGLLAFFEPRMFSAYDVARGKPAPDLFLHAAAARKAVPQRCLVIEDSAAGLAAASAAGMHAAWYCPGDLPDRAGTHRLRAMAEVPGLLTRLGAG
ncbi:MAG: HAD-IA family hydrolase [Proteobacteria bacterium]|nr:HAD-IA family hydrolase [Pseudomonadota bacterium]MDA0952531.1 HAD-IA family hydrolase [Pseudomonadota bacterium]MDA1070650.1 HAD-IA family hydrolase [Pseudomonadota bacterium]